MAASLHKNREAEPEATKPAGFELSALSFFTETVWTPLAKSHSRTTRGKHRMRGNLRKERFILSPSVRGHCPSGWGKSSSSCSSKSKRQLVR